MIWEEPLNDEFLLKAFEVYKTRINTLKEFYEETRIYVPDDIEIDREFGLDKMLDENVSEVF